MQVQRRGNELVGVFRAPPGSLQLAKPTRRLWICLLHGDQSQTSAAEHAACMRRLCQENSCESRGRTAAIRAFRD